MKKKIFLLLPLFALLFAACDPIHEDNGPHDPSLTSEQLVGLISYTQTDKDGNEQADGNYFHYTATRVVQIYTVNAQGAETILATGTKGDFTIAPSRGSSSTQTVYVRTLNTDGSEITGSFDVNVYVATEMSTELKLLVSNSGTKTWTWNPDDSGRAWGNGQYMGNDGADFVGGANIWWGCTAEDLTGQLVHSNTGVATGEEDSNAYMVFSEDGTIKTYDANGNVIREGTFEIKDYDASRSDGWKIGTLHTSAGAILFPFKINGNGEMPTDFDIMQLSAGELMLVYGGNGQWQECTFWRFKSTSDGEGMLTNYSTQKWTWNPDDSGRAWGNGQYMGNSGDDFIGGANVWWGCTAEDLTGQLVHSNTGVATGEEDSNAYMEFSEDGTIKTYDANGNVIRSGVFEVRDFSNKRDANNWAYGTLHTTAGSILFPFKINGGGEMPTDFDIMQLNSNELILVYGGNGQWQECTFWRFKKVE